MPRNTGRAKTKINSKTLPTSEIGNRRITDYFANNGNVSKVSTTKRDTSKSKGSISDISHETSAITKPGKTKSEVKLQSIKNDVTKVCSKLSTKSPRVSETNLRKHWNLRTLQPSELGNHRSKKSTSNEQDASEDRTSKNRISEAQNRRRKVSQSQNKKGSVSKEQSDLSNCENNENGTPKRSKRICKKKDLDCFNSAKALDEIISDLANCARERDKMDNLDRQIMALSTPQKSFTNSPQKTSYIEFKREDSKPWAGIQIIDPKLHQCIFSLKELEKCRDSLDVEHILPFSKMPLSESVCRIHCSLRTSQNNLQNCQFMLFVFRLMSVHNEDIVVNSCLEFLLRQVLWTPSIHDVVEVLINNGVTAEKNCPLLELFSAQSKTIQGVSPRKRKKCDVDNIQLKKPQMLDVYNLGAVFKLLAQLADEGRYEDNVLVQLVFLLCWLLLDSQTRDIHHEMQISMNFCLNAISDAGWNSKWAKELSSRMCQLIDSPKGILEVTNFLFPVGRTENLGKIISLQMAHMCLGEPYCFKHFPKPADMVNLLKLRPLSSLLKDLEFLQVTLCHIECAVGRDAEKTDLMPLKELSHMFRSTAGKIVDSIHSPKATKVKSILFNLACKWTILQQQFVPDGSRDSRESSFCLDSTGRTSQIGNDNNLDYTLPDCLLPSPVKSSSPGGRFKNEVIPSYNTKPESKDSEIPHITGGDSFLNSIWAAISGSPARFQKRRSFCIFQEDNASPPAKKMVIPSYQTKAHELSSKAEKFSGCRTTFPNSESHNHQLKNKTGSGQKSQEKQSTLASLEIKKVSSSSKRKLNFNYFKDTK